MDATDVAQSYFDAWNRRDPEAIVATFAEGGTYTDPNVPEGLRDRAIGEYAAGLFTAFPDLSFDIISPHATGDGTVAARWLMRGTNTGPLRENPPTGATVACPARTSSRWRATKSAPSMDISTEEPSSSS